MPNYRTANRVKANFDEVYQAPTPHAYFAEMNRIEYAIGSEARPFFLAAVNLMRRQYQNKFPIRMLDLGCSYGVGSALVKYGFSFAEIADFFGNHEAKDYRQCVKDTREWLAEAGPAKPISCVGADSSAKTIKFASDSGLLDGGIVQDLEQDQRLTPEECALMQKCNLLICTGAIGYVGERTVSAILQQLGKDQPLPHGPYSVVTILRMFDSEPIKKSFGEHGYKFAAVPDVHLRQRRFHDEKEQAATIPLVRERGLDPGGLEADGYLYADLFVAAPEADFPPLHQAMSETWQKLSR